MASAHVVTPEMSETVRLGSLGARTILPSERSEGRFALVEHPLGPRGLGAPMHTHTYEDEYSFILEGRVGVQIGDETLVAGPGTLVLKPRGIPHAFWNAGDEPARLLEVISPAGFERYFAEMAALLAGGEPDRQLAGELWARYGLEMDWSSLPRLIEEHGLAMPLPR